MKSRAALASSYKGSIASLMRCATSELESAPSASVVPSNDALGAIAYSGSTHVINSATLVAWKALMTPNPFRPFSFRMWIAMMWSQIFFLSFSRMPHFLHDSGASLIRRLVKSDRGTAALFLR